MFLLQEDETCKYYFALLTAGLRPAVVERRMRADGVAEATINMFMLVAKTMVTEEEEVAVSEVGIVKDYPAAAKRISSTSTGGITKPKVRKQAAKARMDSGNNRTGRSRKRQVNLGSDSMEHPGTVMVSDQTGGDERNTVFRRVADDDNGGQWQEAQSAEDTSEIEGYAYIVDLLSSNSDLSAMPDKTWARWYERSNQGQPVTIKHLNGLIGLDDSGARYADLKVMFRRRKVQGQQSSPMKDVGLLRSSPLKEEFKDRRRQGLDLEGFKNVLKDFAAAIRRTNKGAGGVQRQVEQRQATPERKRASSSVKAEQQQQQQQQQQQSVKEEIKAETDLSKPEEGAKQTKVEKESKEERGNTQEERGNKQEETPAEVTKAVMPDTETILGVEAAVVKHSVIDEEQQEEQEQEGQEEEKAKQKEEQQDRQREEEQGQQSEEVQQGEGSAVESMLKPAEKYNETSSTDTQQKVRQAHIDGVESTEIRSTEIRSTEIRSPEVRSAVAPVEAAGVAGGAGVSGAAGAALEATGPENTQKDQLAGDMVEEEVVVEERAEVAKEDEEDEDSDDLESDSGDDSDGGHAAGSIRVLLCMNGGMAGARARGDYRTRETLLHTRMLWPSCIKVPIVGLHAIFVIVTNLYHVRVPIVSVLLVCSLWGFHWTPLPRRPLYSTGMRAAVFGLHCHLQPFCVTVPMVACSVRWMRSTTARCFSSLARESRLLAISGWRCRRKS
jgi:hypothetical protein